MFTENLHKVNDYTLQCTLKKDESDNRGLSSTYRHCSITRIFNYASATVTSIHHSRTFRATAETPPVVFETTHVEKFKDLPSLIEVELMREKLVGMGGHPPTVEEAISGRCTRPLPKTGGL